MNLSTYIFCSSLVAILAREQINKLKPHEIVKKKKNNSQTLQSKKNKDFKSQVQPCSASQKRDARFLSESLLMGTASENSACTANASLWQQEPLVPLGNIKPKWNQVSQAVTSSSATVLIKKTWYWEAESIDCLQGKGHLGSVSWEQHFHLSVHPAE